MNIYHERRSSGRSASVEDGRDMTAVVTMSRARAFTHTRAVIWPSLPRDASSYDASPPPASSPLRLCLAATAS